MSNTTRQAAARRKQQQSRRRTAGLAVAVAVAVAVAFAVAIFGASQASGHHTSDGGSSTSAGAQVAWAPDYADLRNRLVRLGFPPNGDESYHIHVLLHVYVDGEPVTVPANIGTSAADGIESPLHTHDTSGIIHVEAGSPYPFTLGQFFAVWGVAFARNKLDGHVSSGSSALHVVINGTPFAGDPTTYVFQKHDNVVVAFGSPGSFPMNPPTDALEGI